MTDTPNRAARRAAARGKVIPLPITPDDQPAEDETPASDQPTPRTLADEILGWGALLKHLNVAFGIRHADGNQLIQNTLNYVLAKRQLEMQFAPPSIGAGPETTTEETPDGDPS